MKKLITEDGEVINATPYRTQALDPPFFKTPWNHDRDAESAHVGLECKDASRTQQQFAKEADINVILGKFLNTGELNLTGNPVYLDIDEEKDLQDSIVTKHQVEQAWNELPVAVRNILKDPKTFTDYVDHCIKTGDLEPLRELGLAKPEPPQPAISQGGTPDPTTPEAAPTGTAT